LKNKQPNNDYVNTLFIKFSLCDTAAHADRNQQSPRMPCFMSSRVTPSRMR